MCNDKNNCESQVNVAPLALSAVKLLSRSYIHEKKKKKTGDSHCYDLNPPWPWRKITSGYVYLISRVYIYTPSRLCQHGRPINSLDGFPCAAADRLYSRRAERVNFIGKKPSFLFATAPRLNCGARPQERKAGHILFGRLRDFGERSAEEDSECESNSIIRMSYAWWYRSEMLWLYTLCRHVMFCIRIRLRRFDATLCCAIVIIDRCLYTNSI